MLVFKIRAPANRFAIGTFEACLHALNIHGESLVKLAILLNCAAEGSSIYCMVKRGGVDTPLL
jgi:hypothetical protein